MAPRQRASRLRGRRRALLRAEPAGTEKAASRGCDFMKPFQVSKGPLGDERAPTRMCDE